MVNLIEEQEMIEQEIEEEFELEGDEEEQEGLIEDKPISGAINKVDDSLLEDKPKEANEVIDGEIHYCLEKKLADRLRRMAERIDGHGDQNGYIINHGATGSGKTNSAIVEAHFVKTLTGREIILFFRLEQLIEYAKKNENKIIIWDEPAFTSLSTDATTSLNKNLFRLINTSRLKRHLIIINFTKFWRFNSDILTDTAQFMLNMSNKEKKKGRFLYLPQENLDKLWADWARERKKNYAKYKTFGGSMPFIYKKWFSQIGITVDGKKNATYEDYLDLRDKAVNSIGGDNKKQDKNMLKLELLRWRIAQLVKKQYMTPGDLAQALGTSTGRVSQWAKLDPRNYASVGYRPRDLDRKMNVIEEDIEEEEKENEED